MTSALESAHSLLASILPDLPPTSARAKEVRAVLAMLTAALEKPA